MNKVATTVKQAIRDKYAWPGGYPLFLITEDNAVLCCDCGKKEFRNIADAVHRNDNNGWKVIAADINWEDPDLYCDHCSKRIESAYAENKKVEGSILDARGIPDDYYR